MLIAIKRKRCRSRKHFDADKQPEHEDIGRQQSILSLIAVGSGGRNSPGVDLPQGRAYPVPPMQGWGARGRVSLRSTIRV
jgi:hypothetical protein